MRGAIVEGGAIMCMLLPEDCIIMAVVPDGAEAPLVFIYQNFYRFGVNPREKQTTRNRQLGPAGNAADMIHSRERPSHVPHSCRQAGAPTESCGAPAPEPCAPMPMPVA